MFACGKQEAVSSNPIRFVFSLSHCSIVTPRINCNTNYTVIYFTMLGVGKLRPAARMRPSRAFCAAREHFLKLCHFVINTTRGLTRRKSDGVLKKKVIASSLDGKCVGAYNCPQSRIYRLRRKGDDLFFF